MRVALCQDNLTVGDLVGNVECMREQITRAQKCGADIVAFPELAITGYPPEDLLLKPGFIADTGAALQDLARTTPDIVAVVGYPEASATGDSLYNSAAILHNGQVTAVYRKHHLPNYAVFDEQRYFRAGKDALVLDVKQTRIGITICEDIWARGGPAEWLTVQGRATLLLNLSASPYHTNKGRERERLFADRCKKHNCYLAFCNAVGGQDELVFDGHSLVIGPTGNVIARAKQFVEDFVVVDLELQVAGKEKDSVEPAEHDRVVKIATVDIHRAAVREVLQPPPQPTLLDQDAEIYQALTLGTADYVRKNRFSGAVIGLSGGIDSALTLVIAVDALGPEAVTAVSMPSRYTAAMNRTDAETLCDNLGIKLLEIPIETVATSFADVLADSFSGIETNVAEENLQARIRGNLLMALSNKFGWLVLTTGNKSEMSVGYATLYGDMAGGFALLKDVLKTQVYQLAKWRNSMAAIIPQRIIDKAPTAELRENQLDTDNLPPYDELDGILKAYVEHDRTAKEIIASGFDVSTVNHVISLVARSEYKRRQCAPGVRISTRAFGKDRRLPITNRYRPSL